ncbi:hypothetical protein [Streptomyces sp.]|uniref:hypothetical protein n=1 Tax=Streptomyces sp. TaxID=1931 RepID=UPI002F943B45
MTHDRRALGPGCSDTTASSTEDPRRSRASEADLDTALPSVRLPDLRELRERGVLDGTRAAHNTPRPADRRHLRPAAESPGES